MPLFVPGGVAAPSGRVGYTGGVGGGVVALDLRTGAEEWHTSVSARPVVAVDESVFALQFLEGANRLSVVELAAADGRVLRTTGAVELPEWVCVSPVPNERFDYRVKAEEGGGVVVEWEAHAHYEGGAPPPQYVIDQYEKHEAGAFRIDPRDGSVEESEGAGDPAAVTAEASQGDFPVSYRVDGSAAWRTGPWEVGEGFAVLFGEIEEDRQTIYLQTWRGSSAAATKPSKLVTGAALLSYVTPDGRHVLIHSESGGKSPWWVFSAASGERVAELEYEPGTREAAVIESRLYCLTETPTGAVRRCAFKALDLSDGRTLWERTLSERPAQAPPPLRQ